MRSGYILLHRQGLTPDDWKHPLRTLAWIDLLTMVAWDDFTNDDGVLLKRGEVIASISFLEARWRQNRGTIHRWLTHWEKAKMVQRVTQHQSQQVPQRLFVVNYAKYQGGPQQVSQQLVQQVPQPMKVKQEKQHKNIKQVPEEKDDERTGVSFREILVREQWCDEHYASKTWEQGLALRSPHRENFFRKVGVVISSARHDRTKPFAKKVYHEIAGMVNDFGDMARHISDEELADREEF